MKIFVVSIEDENSPRLKKFLGQAFFQKDNLVFEKVGIKGGALSAKEYFELAVKGRSKPLTPGELGCTLSHLRVLAKFLETDENFALILEDDAILDKDFSYQTLYNELMSLDLPENLLLSLGGIQMKECRKVRGKYCKFSLFNQEVLEVVPDFYRRVNYTVSYIVDRKMAKTLLEYHKPIRRTDDWSFLYDFDSTAHIFMTYLVDHPVIEKGETNSNLSIIENERIDNVEISASKYGYGIRKIWAKLKYKVYKI